MKKSYDASVKSKQFEENEEVLLFDPRKKRGQLTKWSVTWVSPFIVKKRLNDCNYVLQKSAKSRPFVVHVDQMRRYLHELDDSETDKPPLSSASDTHNRLPRSSSQMSNGNTPSDLAITHQSVDSTPAAKPAAAAVSTPTDRAPMTAASTATAEVIASLTLTRLSPTCPLVVVTLTLALA